MNAKQDMRVPLRYGVLWDNARMPPVPVRKELETDLLNALVGLAEAFGATDVEVDKIQEAREGNGKIVTLGANGDLDVETLQSALRRVADGFE